jgi:hypothetical protein
MIFCSALAKYITVIVPSTADHYFIGTALISVPKKIFFDEIISPAGKAHVCLFHDRGKTSGSS